MIPRLDIHKLDRGVYEAVVSTGGYPIADPTIHDTITEALADAGANASTELWRYMEVRYAEVSIGTVSVHRLATEAPALAQQLNDLAAEVRFAEEDMAAERRLNERDNYEICSGSWSGGAGVGWVRLGCSQHWPDVAWPGHLSPRRWSAGWCGKRGAAPSTRRGRLPLLRHE